jgi:hypothetical protein
VVPGGPGERAGLRAGDRLSTPDPGRPAWRWAQPVTASAAPGTPLPLERRRDGLTRAAWLVPDPLPDGERWMMAALLLVASGFVLLGGWVWSERRDRLTRPFYLLSLAFARLLAPVPRFPWPALGALHELLYAGLTLLLPALFVHFFALFPEPRAPRGRMAAGVAAAYGVAALLSAGWLVRSSPSSPCSRVRPPSGSRPGCSPHSGSSRAPIASPALPTRAAACAWRWWGPRSVWPRWRR